MSVPPRLWPEPDPSQDDSRSAFQRDRDRVLYSSQLSRLASTTQVVSASEGHLFHNRLTHTLEVAQIARRIAEKLGEYTYCDPDVVEAAALAHDLGHPPFGHAGEVELDEILRRLDPESDGYEGNAQSFRIITRLAMLRRTVCGLNLTKRTLLASLKYPWPRSKTEDANDKRWKKYGIYRDDLTTFKMLTGDSMEIAKSLEAEVMDYADDIAYSVHDLLDFYRAGLIPLHRYVSDRDLFDQLIESLDLDDDTANRIYDSIIRIFPLEHPYDRSNDSEAEVRRLSSTYIGRYIGGVKIKDEQLVVKPEYAREIEVLKQFTRHHVFNNPSLRAIQFGQRQLLRHIIEVIWNDGRPQKALIPPEAQAGFDDPTQSPIRIISDFVSGLTEDQVYRFHARISGRSLGSIGDRIF